MRYDGNDHSAGVRGPELHEFFDPSSSKQMDLARDQIARLTIATDLARRIAEAKAMAYRREQAAKRRLAAIRQLHAQLQELQAHYQAMTDRQADERQRLQLALASAVNAEAEIARRIRATEKQYANAYTSACRWDEIRRSARALSNRASERDKRKVVQLRLELAATRVRAVRIRVQLRAVSLSEDQVRRRLINTIIHRGDLERIDDGMRTHGFQGYLAKASSQEVAILHEIHAEMQCLAKERCGRVANSGDPDAARKAKRAQLARDRYTARTARLPVPVTRRERSGARKPRVGREKAHISVAVPAAMRQYLPQVRHHEARIANMRADDRLHYSRLIYASRIRGAQAVEHDVAHRQSLAPVSVYHAPHCSIRISDQARIIAVRDECNGATSVARIESNPMEIESWLAEPAILRAEYIGPRARLKYAAAHIVAAWPATLMDRARLGELDVPLAFEVDCLIARLGLSGHRLAAFLHLDAEHPHLHIVFSRVSATDLSLWTLDGRSRAPTLWLHARSNTVHAHGAEALRADIDCLGGSGSAAVAGELLMASQRLVATRKYVNGDVAPISMQGVEAARRINDVGILSDCLVGGWWSYGLGRESIVNDIVAGDDHSLSSDSDLGPDIAVVKSQKRGGWLPINMDNRASADPRENGNRFVKYLSRVAQ